MTTETVKHTPGKWTIERVSGRWKVYSPSGIMVARAGGVDDGQEEANARLIASAPELLEACCAALPFVEAQDRGDEPGPVTELADKLRAAIDKAQGK